MSDFEKNRAEYVTHLEAQVQNLQQQLLLIKNEERWIPKVGSSISTNAQTARITLAFGGKNQTAEIDINAIKSSSVRDISTQVVSYAFQQLINERIREVIEPEVERLKNGVNTLPGAK